MWQEFSSTYKKYLLIFLVVFTVFMSNVGIDFSKDLENKRFRRMMTSTDVVPNTFLPWLIIYKQTLSFDSIIDSLRQIDGRENPSFLVKTDKENVSSYPVFSALMALPIYFIPVVLDKIPEVTYHENILKVFLLGRITASFYTALSVVLFYRILERISKNRSWILIFTAFYAFGTNTWTTMSRGMWQHTFAQFFISLVLLLLLTSLKNKKLIPWIGFLLGIMVATRPTTILFAVVISIYVLMKHRDQLLRYVIAVLPSIIFLLLYNYFTFGSVLVEGYGARNNFDWSTPLTESLLGYAFSPSRSFLFVSPPLVLAYFAIYKLFKNKDYLEKYNSIFRYLSVGFILSLLMMAKWYTWDGSNNFGYRMLSDMLPIVGLLSFLVVERLKPPAKKIIIVLIFYSILMNANAVINRKSRCSQDHVWSFYCLSPPKELSKY